MDVKRIAVCKAGDSALSRFDFIMDLYSPNAQYMVELRVRWRANLTVEEKKLWFLSKQHPKAKIMVL